MTCFNVAWCFRRGHGGGDDDDSGLVCQPFYPVLQCISMMHPKGSGCLTVYVKLSILSSHPAIC